MSNDNKFSKPVRKQKSLSSYIKNNIPREASVEYIISEDFNKDGTDEAVIAVSLYFPYPPVSYLFCVWDEKNELGYNHKIIQLTDSIGDTDYCILDNLLYADIDGDGVSEIVQHTMVVFATEL